MQKDILKSIVAGAVHNKLYVFASEAKQSIALCFISEQIATSLCSSQ